MFTATPTRDKRGRYVFKSPASAAQILEIAEQITAERFYREDVVSSPASAVAFLQRRLALRQSEVFAVAFLDNRHRVIAFREMFVGTIDGASVHPREVVRAALEHNAAALLIAHNHPSGNSEPSQADIAITRRLCDALALIDVRVLDHVIIAGTSHVSLAERGLM